MKKRVLCLCLVFVLILSFASCAAGSKKNTQNNPSGTTAASTTETLIDYEEDELPELDFGGATVTFLTPADAENGWFADEITVEGLTSESVNDSVYNRELFVEERLNVEIENHADIENYANLVTQMINSGDDSYQILSQRTLHLSKFVPLGYLTNLYDVNYIDFTKPWWSSKFNDEAEIMDNLFITTGSISLSLKRFLFAVFYNKKVAEDYSKTIPELADIYSIVESGKWTIDKMQELGGELYIDLNGDSNRDIEDFYGIGMNLGISVDPFWSGFDISVFTKDEDGFFTLNVDTEKLFNALDKLRGLMHNTRGTFNADIHDVSLGDLETKLASDSLLFAVDRILAVEGDILRNMQNDYGILPYPKYDEAQDEYYSYAHDQYTSVAIPITVQNIDCAGAVLEAMASFSYRDTDPAYLDMALKGKYMNDMQSRRMIDIVINGFKVDASWIYVETFANRFPSKFRDVVTSDDSAYNSTYTALKKTCDKTLPIQKREFAAMLEEN